METMKLLQPSPVGRWCTAIMWNVRKAGLMGGHGCDGVYQVEKRAEKGRRSCFDSKHIAESLIRQSLVHLALLCSYTYAPKARRN